MQALRLVFLFLGLTFFNTHLSAQEKGGKIITEVTFDGDKIILNKKQAYVYVKDGNSFIISDLAGEAIIKGEITALGQGKFSSVITFVKSGKPFSNDKMIGRNALVFALCENNVIQKDFKLDDSKLSAFMKKYNQLR